MEDMIKINDVVTTSIKIMEGYFKIYVKFLKLINCFLVYGFLKIVKMMVNSVQTVKFHRLEKRLHIVHIDI